MSTLGQICLVGALALAVYAVAASLVGVRLRLGELVASGQNADLGVTVLLTGATAALVAALVGHDFSLRYAWDHSSRAMPLDLVVPAFYSGQQGSLLYWAWTLSLFAAVVLWQQRRPGPHRAFMPYVVAVLMTVEAFMTFLLHALSASVEPSRAVGGLEVPREPPRGWRALREVSP